MESLPDMDLLPHQSAASNLFGKTVLITGASSGIGRSTALEFARTSPQSLKLVLTARRLGRLQGLAAQINSEVGDGVEVCVKQLDVSRPDEIEAIFGEQGLPEHFRDVDVLVNNACVFHRQTHFPY
jgi:3-hydroxy acid dehydrogenase/malonic semialdehyde reductase